MNFGENLIALRKTKNMTQEQLAEKLDVTRQTIYKYETNQTNPEMDKLVLLSKIFNITLDELVNAEVSGNTTRPSKDEILKHYKKFFNMIGLGVFIILLGCAQITIWEDLLKENSKLASLLPLTIFFILIIISIIIFIYYGMDEKGYRDENELTFETSKKEKNKINKISAIGISSGVALILIGVIILIILDALFDSKYSWPASILLLFIGIAVFLFIRFGGLLDLYSNKDLLLPEDKKKNTLASKISGAIMLLATICFLLCGFLIHNGFAFSWLAYPVGGILCGIVSIFTNNN